jgi:hypothetical protein
MCARCKFCAFNFMDRVVANKNLKLDFVEFLNNSINMIVFLHSLLLYTYR